MNRLLNVFINNKAFRFTLLAVSVSLFITGQANAINFVVQLEADNDQGAGSEVGYTLYDSLPDLLSNTVTFGTSPTGVFSPVGINSAFSTTGLAFDGNKGGRCGRHPRTLHHTVVRHRPGGIGHLEVEGRKEKLDNTLRIVLREPLIVR